ncbi:MAG: hypothetical protein U0837_02505 [Dehalococcoidia bacterium]
MARGAILAARGETLSAHRTLTNGLIVAAAGALLAMLVFFLSRDVTVGYAPPATAYQPTPSAGPYEQAIQKRAQIGLRTDLDWVIEVENDPAAIRVWWGMALTKDEAAVLEQRGAALEKALMRVIPLLEEVPGFGGVYLRYSPSDALVVVDGGSNGRIAAALTGVDVPVVIQQGRYSLAQLSELTYAISVEIDSLRASEGIQIVTVGPDIVNNRVEVGVYQLNESQARRLKARYGEMIHVVPEVAPFHPLIEAKSD